MYRFFILFLLFSCEVDETVVIYDPTAEIFFPTNTSYQDTNNIHHVDLDWTLEYLPYFELNITADKLPDEITSATFDSDTYWVLEDSLAFTIPLYSPYLGLETYQGTPIPVNDTIVYLNQFKGDILNIVQDDRVYFYDNGTGFDTKRLVGPFPPELEGDTINIYMKVIWEQDNYWIEKDFTEKFIVE